MNGKRRPGQGGVPKTAASSSGADSTPAPPKEWLSVAELAEWLGVKPSVIYWANFRGDLSGHRIGRELRYHRDEVRRFLAARAVRP